MRNLPYFNRINGNRILETFHYQFQEKTFKKGDILFEEGKKGDLIYFIFDGWVSLSKDIEFLVKTENEMTIEKKISLKISEIGKKKFFLL